MKHEITVPEVGESISEVVVAEWLKQDGEYVDVDDVICEIESDKASFEVPSDKAGTLQIKAQTDDTVSVGDVLAVIDTEGEGEDTAEEEPEPEKTEEPQEAEEESPKEPEEEPQEAEEETEEPTSEGVRVSPVASNVLKEAGIDPSGVKGTGIGGKITKADAQRAVKDSEKAQPSEEKETQKKSKPAKETASKAVRPEQFTGEREVERKRMSTLRRTIADRLVNAQNDAAMLTTFNEVDMSAVKQVRAEHKEQFEEKHGVRLGFMSFFTRACALALQEFPVVNAKIDGNEIVYHKYADIAMAVSTDRGLVVPVIRNADKLSFAQIEQKVNELADRARNNKLDIEEMRGGTFTISNGGVFGSLMSTPIINAPQSAILGLHKIEDRPVAIDGEVVVRPMMYVAMSYDHRLIDGKDSVQFLVRVKELIEAPSRMLLDV
ncbi:MAG: 2-oxoglutarate dehydrogenase complex dihydrolipoyllysine-residue succinyltransferase [Candidatus Marinimicrobia bacterium]|nr:2-oxoglutarate dehydrogenase complex dihydrolipoyllysine-residue succinyltransferase [Candidatus Neomarinimicrobiota bacterium]MCF7828501.1 2-oxoglutarate dehydrogenase complex dihydrolipoyllysine-residue succinyltransferase [Candidatus Neomarinimicrobiota bacterium]MCF7881991.1 2-oxoglutarate dehydrogenase complex dihydrolipoyllysine-residue succinyltransferase [Candidatus Neomarinimicrobiota bacterium]